MSPTNTLALLLFIIVLTSSDEWYMPDSNLISETEFDEKIIQDKHSFKFVKYFTPHCPYCRYLKQVIDVLKHKKQWCFKIYDFNCQWYPQFCMNHVRSSSFPYTAIHNEKGDLEEEIHGFYPEPIISAIFDRTEQKCLQARIAANLELVAAVPIVKLEQVAIQANTQQQQPQKVEIPQKQAQNNNINSQLKKPQTVSASLSANQQETPVPKVEHKTAQPQQPHPPANTQNYPQPARQVNVQHQPNPNSIPPIDFNAQQKTQQQHQASTQTTTPPKQQHKSVDTAPNHSQQSPQPIQSHTQKNEQEVKHQQTNAKIHSQSKDQPKNNKTQSSFQHGNYLFYAICLAMAGYYVYTLHTQKQNPEVKTHQHKHGKEHHHTQKTQTPSTHKHYQPQQQPQNDVNVEQNELLNLPDEAL